MTTVKNVSSLVKELNASNDLKTEFNQNPLKFLENVEDAPPMNNLWVFIAIVGIVAAVLIASMVMSFIFLYNSDLQTAKVPEFLVSISSTALGAIVGLLAPTPGRN